MVSVRVLNPRKGQSKWAPDYEVLREDKGALLLKSPAGHEVRINQSKVRALPEELPYDACDPLPVQLTKHPRVRTDLPDQAELVIPSARVPLVARAAPSYSEWRAWCSYVTYMTY